MRMPLSALVLLVLTLTGMAADPLDADVEAFKKRLTQPCGQEDRRPEVSAFMRRRIGTPAATQAGELLHRLPSPLDHLDAKTIPELERFSWQPKELVAVLGEHRGRHGSYVSAIQWTP